jgi:hypothetical protein
MKRCTGLSRQGLGKDSCVHGDEPSGFISVLVCLTGLFHAAQDGSIKNECLSLVTMFLSFLFVICQYREYINSMIGWLINMEQLVTLTFVFIRICIPIVDVPQTESAMKSFR